MTYDVCLTHDVYDGSVTYLSNQVMGERGNLLQAHKYDITYLT